MEYFSLTPAQIRSINDQIRSLIADGGGTITFGGWYKSALSVFAGGVVDCPADVWRLMELPRIRETLATARRLGFGVHASFDPDKNRPQLTLEHVGVERLGRQGIEDFTDAALRGGFALLDMRELREIMEQRIPKDFNAEQTRAYRTAIGDMGLFYREAIARLQDAYDDERVGKS